MEMHQLRYFLALARTRHFSRAAQECHVSQPSLSQQIRKLEEELGGPLFLRTTQGAELTEAGTLFLPYAQRICREVQEASRAVGQAGTVVRGRLQIGVLPTIAPYLLPGLLEHYSSQYPEVEVIVQEEITPRLLAGLEEGSLDLALLSLPVGEGVETLWFEEELLLVLPEAHPLAGEETVAMSQIAGERFILMHEGHCLSAQALDFCHAKGFTPSVSCRSAQVETLLALVRAGMGLSIVPQMAARPGAGIVYRPFGGTPPMRKIGVVRRENRACSAAMQAWIDLGRVVTNLINPPL